MVNSNRFWWMVAALGSMLPAALVADDGLVSTDARPDVEVVPGEVRLTHDGFFKRDPVFWPGTDELLYTVESPDGNMRIVRRQSADGSTENFDEESGISDRELTVSSDGQVIAYNRVSGLSSRIHVEDRRRNRRWTVPKIGKHSWSNWPSLSPDGLKLIYVEGAKVMYEFDLERGRGKEDIRPLTPDSIGAGSDYFPRYTPDGQTILFASTRDQDFEIYAMNHDGTAPRRLTDSPGADIRPVASPDGESICFTSNRDGNYEIYVMRSDGTDVRRVTDNPERDDFAIWSPDGSQLVYVSERNGRFDLYRLPCP